MRNIVVTVLLILVSTACFSQFRFGLMFSPNVSWVRSDGDAIARNGAGWGFNYGLMFNFDFSQNYSIQSGVFVNHPQVKVTNAVDTGDIQLQTYRLQYVEIPLIFKLKTNEIGRFIYFGLFGLTNQMRVRARVESVAQDKGGTPVKTNANDLVNFYNLALTVGGGFEFNISGNTNLLISFSYNNGFINLLKDTGEKTFLNTFTLRTGIMF